MKLMNVMMIMMIILMIIIMKMTKNATNSMGFIVRVYPFQLLESPCSSAYNKICRIIDICIKVKDHGYIHHENMHHGYKHHGYMHYIHIS